MAAFVGPLVLPSAIPGAKAQDIECTTSGSIWYLGPQKPNQAIGDGQAACTGNPDEIILEISISPANGGLGTPMYGTGNTGLVPVTCIFQSWCQGSAGNYNTSGSISYNHCWFLYVQATVNGLPYKQFPAYRLTQCF